MVRRLIATSGISEECYSEVIGEIESLHEYTTSLDEAIGESAPQDWGTVQAIYDEMIGERDYIASMAAYYESQYEISKKNFFLDKSEGTERFRERFQDAGSAPWVYLKKRYDERLRSLDKALVRFNKILERENILTNRGAS
jgi:hypothetical protein